MCYVSLLLVFILTYCLVIIKYSPGGEYSLLLFSCCSVWAKSWSLSSENCVYVSSLFFRRVRFIIMLPNFDVSFLFRTAQSFLWLDPSNNLYLVIRNLIYLREKIFSCGINYFLFSPQIIFKFIFILKFIYFLFFKISQTQENTRKFQPLTEFCFHVFWVRHIYIYTYTHRHTYLFLGMGH